MEPFKVCFMFYNKAPASSLVLENAATETEMLCGLRKLRYDFPSASG